MVEVVVWDMLLLRHSIPQLERVGLVVQVLTVSLPLPVTPRQLHPVKEMPVVQTIMLQHRLDLQQQAAEEQAV
jgi:hypothetical protein